jgi:hypothetical protein
MLKNVIEAQLKKSKIEEKREKGGTSNVSVDPRL